MTGLAWLRPVYSYLVESTLETAIIFLLVQAILRLWGRNRPIIVSQLLLLPLIVPVLVSPGLHLLFPRLADLALVTHLERVTPWLELAGEKSLALAPLLAVAFGFVLATNVMLWTVLWLREMREDARMGTFGGRQLPSAWLRILKSYGLGPSQLHISRRHPLGAYIFGWRRPVLAIGQAWISRLDASEVEALVAHELAHFRSGDNWLVLVAKGCRDLMFFNPLAHHIYSRFVAAREEAADDAAVVATGKPFALASCLLKFWQAGQVALQPAGRLTFAQTAGLERRIHRIVNGDAGASSARNAPLLVYAVSVVVAAIFSVV